MNLYCYSLTGELFCKIDCHSAIAQHSWCVCFSVVHTVAKAVSVINWAVDSGDSAATLVALQAPAANLRSITEECAADYTRSLAEAKSQGERWWVGGTSHKRRTCILLQLEIRAISVGEAWKSTWTEFSLEKRGDSGNFLKCIGFFHAAFSQQNLAYVCEPSNSGGRTIKTIYMYICKEHWCIVLSFAALTFLYNLFSRSL